MNKLSSSICINRVQHSPEASGELGDSGMPWVSHWAEGTLTHWGTTQTSPCSLADISIPLLKHPTFPHLPFSPGSAVAAGLHSELAHPQLVQGEEKGQQNSHFHGWLCPESEDIEVSFLISLLVSWATQQAVVLSPPVPQAMAGISCGQMMLPVLGFLPKVEEE